MKIEKISDTQIRCTLTREDLDNHQIRLSELAYGTEKAKNLFRDMMQQAHKQFGFEADNIPLMIEAIPVNKDSIILIITKVEDPEELDTRFSKFAPSRQANEELLEFSGADSIIDMFQKIYESKAKGTAQKPASKAVSSPDCKDSASVNLVRLFLFPNLEHVIEAARGLNNYYTGINSLYKNHRDSGYMLVVHQSAYTPEEFNKVCNILSEYGKDQPFSHAAEMHLREHGDAIISDKALQKLQQL